jgi:hypothetical protein
MTDFNDHFGSNHTSLPTNECGNELPHTPTDNADDAAETLAPYGFRRIMQFLRRWQFCFGFRQRLGDTAPTAFDHGRLICHAALAKPIPVFPLTVAVILPNLRVLLITVVGFLPLLLPALVPASIAAIGLSAITRPTDEKHQPAIHSPAK